MSQLIPFVLASGLFVFCLTFYPRCVHASPGLSTYSILCFPHPHVQKGSFYVFSTKVLPLSFVFSLQLFLSFAHPSPSISFLLFLPLSECLLDVFLSKCDRKYAIIACRIFA